MKTKLVLTSSKNNTSCNGFKWPKKGKVKCPDWEDDGGYEHGFLGLLWGQGDGDQLDWDSNWIVVEVLAGDIRDAGELVKFPKGNVVFYGDRHSATRYIYERAPEGTIIVGLSFTFGDKKSILAGNGSSIVVNNCSSVVVGNFSKVIAGDYSLAFAGNDSVVTVGNYGRAKVDNYGTATAGYWGTAIAGYGGTATVGFQGKAKAGENGRIVFDFHDGTRYRTIVAYVGENGILPDTFYKLDNKGNVIPA